MASDYVYDCERCGTEHDVMSVPTPTGPKGRMQNKQLVCCPRSDEPILHHRIRRRSDGIDVGPPMALR
jgi:hypothetical protein